MSRNALGLIEVNGLVAAIEAADAMLKSASVQLSHRHIISPGQVTVVVEGDIASCRAAVDAGSAAAALVGRVIAQLVIGRPDNETRHLATPGLALSEQAGKPGVPAATPEALSTDKAVVPPLMPDQDDAGSLDAVEKTGRLLAYIAATQRGRTAQEVARHFKKHFGAVRSLLERLAEDGQLQRKNARYVALTREPLL